MKRTGILIVFLTFFLNICTVEAQRLPSKKQLLTVLRLANNYFMNEWPDPGKPVVTNKERPSNLWTRAVYYEGLMALYAIDPQKKYYEYVVNWGEKHQWGLWGGTGTKNADNQCCGQTYIDLYQIDKKSERIRDIKTCIDRVVEKDGNEAWSWIDAIQMAMPVFARLGAVYGDKKYSDKMYALYAFTKNNHGGNGLYNKEEHLWWRDKDFVPPYKEPNGRNCYWSRGNGWVFAALVRVLDILPKSDPHYNEYLQDFKDMAAALLTVQQPDGLWTASLLDPGHYGGKEITGSALFTYGFAWGVRRGILDRSRYLPAASKAWNTMVRDAVHKNGFLGYVQGTGKEPKDGQPVTYASRPDFEDYGLGCFLLAGSELYRLR
ncbi:glycoside hydrolase family 88 protein [Niabella sp. CC-SYL272]|uniref:glycoside hydrolase family 88/105 protein n=1 Tax=Niabella agricola TaxID=2891571 RepID=UPI001F40510A|nr:glycoside hydrolase family 88 protein [Niabella agricola]MCF3108143.1 glycoside hydrolase family 88 protein [Niabella agricola]